MKMDWQKVEIITRKAKFIHVAGRGDPYGSEKSMLSHFLDNRLTDGGEVVSLKRRAPFTTKKIPDTRFG
jgi:hypothetical protein